MDITCICVINIHPTTKPNLAHVISDPVMMTQMIFHEQEHALYCGTRVVFSINFLTYLDTGNVTAQAHRYGNCCVPDVEQNDMDYKSHGGGFHDPGGRSREHEGVQANDEQLICTSLFRETISAPRDSPIPRLTLHVL